MRTLCGFWFVARCASVGSLSANHSFAQTFPHSVNGTEYFCIAKSFFSDVLLGRRGAAIKMSALDTSHGVSHAEVVATASFCLQMVLIMGGLCGVVATIQVLAMRKQQPVRLDDKKVSSVHSGKPSASRDSLSEEPLDRLALLEDHADAIRALCCAAGGKHDEMESLAYLRASKFDVAVAARRLQETDKWRSQTSLSIKMADREWREAERATRSILLYDYLGLDRYGRPVMVERVGAWDVSAVLLVSADSDRFTTLHTMACETLALMRRPGWARDPRGTVLIMDMRGLSRSHLSLRLLGVFRALNDVDAAFYPDSVAHIFVVNAPGIFGVLSSMVRPLLDPDTSSKFHIASGVPEELRVVVGKECLPEELGGIRRGMFPYDTRAQPSRHPVSN